MIRVRAPEDARPPEASPMMVKKKNDLEKKKRFGEKKKEKKKTFRISSHLAPLHRAALLLRAALLHRAARAVALASDSGCCSTMDCCTGAMWWLCGGILRRLGLRCCSVSPLFVAFSGGVCCSSELLAIPCVLFFHCTLLTTT